MNVTVQKTLLFALFGVLCLFFSPLSLFSQYYQASMTVLKDGQQEYYFESSYRPAGILPQRLPRNGRVWQDRTLLNPSTGSTTYVLIYKPNPGFIGLDTFYYNRKTCPGTLCYEEWQVTVAVRESRVEAKPDLFFTTANSPTINLNVLQNDVSDAGGLQIVKITTVNNCSATFPMGSPTIQFQPAPGFAGIASLNYTVCDKFGTCDQASVNVVVDAENRTKIDTMAVYTVKNEPLPLLIPSVYNLVGQPQHGEFDGAPDIPVYYPDLNFSGVDYLRFSRNGMEKVFAVNVLNYTRNRFAFDDLANVAPGQQVEIDVLANDLYGYGAGCVSSGRAKYGRVITDPNNKGLLIYEAPKGFVGVDEFTYNSYPPGCGQNDETAKVFIYVSNFEPNATKFRVNTPKTTPLVLAYSAPIFSYNFQVQKQGRLGRTIFLPGSVDTVILGQRVQGYNLILYVPSAGVVGLDEVELTYCSLDGNGSCRLRKNIKLEIDILNVGSDSAPSCFSDCVWMGDTNLDGLVNMEDLLPLGLNMGYVGNPRDNIDTNQWYGQFGDDWFNPFSASDINLKHLDTDGDSVITALDTFSISKFYGLTHSIIPVQLPYYNFEIQLQAEFDEIAPGDTLYFDLVLGTEKQPVVDLYGFTFSLPYNPTFFDPNSFSIEFIDDSWMAYNSPVVAMSRNNQKGLLEAGFTRTNQAPISGRGKVAKGKGVVSDFIEGVEVPEGERREQFVELGGGTAVGYDAQGNSFGIRVAPLRVKIKTPQRGNPAPGPIKVPTAPEIFGLFPNPASDWVRLDAPKGRVFQHLQVFNAQGQLVRSLVGGQQGSYEISVQDLPAGMYFVKATDQLGNALQQKFEVQK